MLVGPGAKIRKLYNRVTNEKGELISEYFLDTGTKLAYQYWDVRDELWIDREGNELDVLSWSPQAIDNELRAKGFDPGTPTSIAGQTASVMERKQTPSQAAPEWLALPPSNFHAQQFLNRVFISQSPFVGLHLGSDNILQDADGRIFVLDSDLATSWEVLATNQTTERLFNWQAPAAKKVRDTTK
jgi:hypothetical protein